VGGLPWGVLWNGYKRYKINFEKERKRKSKTTRATHKKLLKHKGLQNAGRVKEVASVFEVKADMASGKK